ncbi:MAG TPA: hypothetical protein PL182_06695 [Pseudobdellovibrionaceae bacterium]|nr:hypothetical protein [Pseudobdellovibrionaceae bacterium]
MHEISQDIFPICAFGRAENLFYHSKGSLLREDLSRERILKDVASLKNPIFPSHLLDRPDWRELLTDLQGKSPRLLIALGREWEELEASALEAQRHGWGLDLLVDRPLGYLHVPEALRSLTDIRWLVSPLRYYNPVHIVRSLEAMTPLSRIALCFLEPAKAHGLLPNMEELMLGRMRISEEPDLETDLRLLVLRHPTSSANAFFQNPTRERYQEQFQSLEKKESLRSAIGRFFRAFPALSAVLAFLLGARLLASFRELQETSRKSGQSLTNFFFDWGRKFFWVGYDAAHRLFFGLFYGLPRMGRFAVLLLQKTFWKIRHLIRMTFIFLRYLPGRLKAAWVRAVWKVHGILVSPYWRLRTALGRAIGFVFWPLRKIYWILEYQAQTRLLPFLQKARRK